MSSPLSIGRALLSVWFVWHLFVMSVDLSKHVAAPGSVLDAYSELRDYTEWYQWRVGLHQNWSMFVPNPRMSTVWLEVEGIRPDKTRIPLPLVDGRPDPAGAIWAYSRAGKHERNAVAEHRNELRMAYTRYYCARWAAAGEPLKSVEFFAASVYTPPPEKRAEKPRAEWRSSRVAKGGWNCPR